MARPNPLRVLMNTPLPPKTLQRRKFYRPSLRQVYKLYDLLNYHIFQNTLVRPKITMGRTRDFWAECSGSTLPHRNGSYCELKLSDKWFCVQWLVVTLAHEMVHQYQWEVEGWDKLKEGRMSIMNHGASFYAWREHLSYYQVPLYTYMSGYKWLTTQRFD